MWRGKEAPDLARPEALGEEEKQAMIAIRLGGMGRGEERRKSGFDLFLVIGWARKQNSRIPK
ncbi:MAG: hypothetical protein NT157_06725 [Candidatus Micrarchaeota archaeon]|nr:hypothetical protein [Candidatus Micrarchaeota archaeon]